MAVTGNLYRRKKGESCSSGSDIFLESNLHDLRPHVKRIDVVSLSKEGLANVEQVERGITVYRTDEKDIAEMIVKLAGKGDYDYLLTQLLLSDVAIKTAKKLGLPAVYMFRSLGVKLDMTTRGEFAVEVMTANSEYVAKSIEKQYNRPVERLAYSIGDIRRIQDTTNPHPKFDVTIFNPTENKGGKIFFELVKRFPELKFCAVRGWMELKDNSGKYNRNMMRLMELAHTGQKKHIYIPTDIPIPQLPNLTVINPIARVGKVYQNTKIVLVPSQWEEAIPGVIMESAANGKLVLASNVAGIGEAMEISGITKKMLVNDFRNVDAWEKKLRWYLQNQDRIPTPRLNLAKPNLHKILLRHLR